MDPARCVLTTLSRSGSRVSAPMDDPSRGGPTGVPVCAQRLPTANGSAMLLDRRPGTRPEAMSLPCS